MKQAKTVTSHLQIAEDLITKIRLGEYQANEKIPSEHTLCQKYQVPRHMVRQAIARLTNLGWVTPVQGKGSYIKQKPKPIPYILSAETSYSNNMQEQGIDHTSKLIDWEITNPNQEEKSKLKLGNGEKVYRLEIVRFARKQPMSITTTTLPKVEFPNLEKHFIHFKSLYRIFLDHYQLQPVRSMTKFQAILPLLSDAEMLGIPENIPIIQMESMVNHPNGVPIEYNISRIRGDMHQCVVEF
ncbi:GntR family transcriptional regulator [Gracilibacillus sp. YIM 98692]|uniref:GntR family transcriptional regulator n=1 Tax=Gracilibacillus sp. YIM 98692 TaxID=2663532 RepID=UPI0013D864A5|nr:GntR family transcriptional regulator [Gracilibacillus sp. YIM 98692]